MLRSAVVRESGSKDLVALVGAACKASLLALYHLILARETVREPLTWISTEAPKIHAFKHPLLRVSTEVVVIWIDELFSWPGSKIANCSISQVPGNAPESSVRRRLS